MDRHRHHRRPTGAASFAIAARRSTHGPTPVSSGRVERTSTPRAVSSCVTRMATSVVKACSA
ncbi:hypothetical protein PH190_00695 [Actinomycetospora straminea]|nr:hypothetical protein [Actinomycetospora straminea]MDD7930954.1 hypothetical protein [Actinomycetospora straminea]